MIQVINADCIEGMRSLPAESVHLIVTSPPYWGLRDYGIPPSTWPDGWVGVFGLEPTPELYVEHTLMIFREARRVLRKDGTLWVNLGDSYATGAGKACSPGGGAQGERWEGPKGYRGNHDLSPKHARPQVPDGKNPHAMVPTFQPNRMPQVGLKPGDLVGIPWRVALAMQGDGWFLRRDNIWFKPNPMPESVNGWRWERCRIKVGKSDRVPAHHKSAATSEIPHSVGLTRAGREGRANIEAPAIDCPGCDKCAPNGGLVLRKGNWRCTTSHEYVFQFSKSDSYFCDAEAGRERTTGNAHARGSGVNPKAKSNGPNSRMVKSRVPREGDDKPNASVGNVRPRQNASFSSAVNLIVSNRNRRSVWTIATAPYREAHFATFPPNLVRPIIQAASPVKCCGKCGAPWAPVVQRGEPNIEQQRACGGDANGAYNGTATKDFLANGAEDASAVKARILAGMVRKTVIDHRPTCRCGAVGVPARVLDMFGGSGTTAQVAGELGRDAILIELNPNYIPLIHKRTAAPGLAL